MKQGFIRKSIIRLTAAGILFLSAVLAGFSLSVCAAEDQDPDDDFTYTGPLDPETSEPVREGEKKENGRIRLSENMEYDKDTGYYVYSFNNGLAEVRSTAADGMYTKDSVAISTAADSSIVVYKDGSLLTGKIEAVKEPGEYIVSTQSGADFTRLFAFTILRKSTNGLQHFNVPEGFYMSDAKLNGSGYNYTRYGADLESEGNYILSYICRNIKKYNKRKYSKNN